DARALSGSSLALDYAVQDPAAPFSVRLLPGQHWLKTYGGDYTYFKVNADGTVDYDAALEGVLTGRGTSSLGVNGAVVQVDARALSGSSLTLDYAVQDPAAPFSVRLLPGQHWLKTYGGDYTYFNVNADGTVDYDAALEGVLTGRGTNSLSVNGALVQVDATALS